MIQPSDGSLAWSRPSGNARSGLSYLRLIGSDSNGGVWSGGSLYQDIPWVPSTNQSYVFSFWAKSPSGTCINISVVLIAVGGTEERQETVTGVCSPSWVLYSAPMDVVYSNHTHLRATVYVWTPWLNLDIDATEMIQTMDNNASFERGPSTGPWNSFGSLTRGGVEDGTARSGKKHIWVRPSSGVPSIYQDINMAASPGESYTFSVWIRSPAGQALDGSINIFEINGPQDRSATYFSTASYPGVWNHFTTTLDVKYGGHTGFRVQIYFYDVGFYYSIDATAVYRKMVGNASFEQTGPCPAWPPPAWSGFHPPGGTFNYCVNASGSPREGVNLLAVNSNPAGGSLYQDIPITPATNGESYSFSIWAKCRDPGQCGAGKPGIWIGVALFALGTGEAQTLNVLVNATYWQQYNSATRRVLIQRRHRVKGADLR
jgi:hypothetical protein